MYVVNNSPRALLLAILPLAVAHAVMTTFVLLALKAAEINAQPPDQVLTFYAARLAIDGALLFVGHFLLRQRAISGRMAYASMVREWRPSATPSP